MCGLTGFWSGHALNTSEALAQIERMSLGIRHRGPDDAGAWYDPEAQVGLGHRRLSIVDLSTEGHQPMRSPSGRYTIVFNGEVYNFGELKRELEAAPGAPSFRGGSDTEVMLAAFERWGVPEATRRFVGMFAFALWDASERKLMLVRDRVGIKPLYYGQSGGSLLFASELHALKRYPGFASEIDVGALGAYFQFGYVPCPRSIFRDVRKLPPGTIASFASATSEPVFSRYWSAEEIATQGRRWPFRGSLDDAADELERLLGDAVRLRMIADVPLGAFLSGGIDSSLVVAVMQKQGLGAVRTFSIGNEAAGYDESANARAVAQHLGTVHTAFRVTEQEALDVAPRLGAMYDEPFADSSQIPTFLVSRLARSQVTVALSGDGGDELFGGYNRHVWAPRVLAGLHWVPLTARRALSSLMTSVSPDRWDRAYQAASAVLPKLRLPGDKVHKLAGVLSTQGAADMYTRLCSQWQDPGQLIAGHQGQGMTRNVLHAPDELDSFAAQMMFMDLVTYLPDDILTKVDRASMNVALEARVPLLDHRVVEFAWTLPDTLKVSGTTGKLVMRRLLDRYFPPGQFAGAKMGFGVPIATWLRGPLNQWAIDLLSPAVLRRSGLLSEEPIQQALTEHLSGARDRSQQLWTVLMFVSWLEEQSLG